MDSWSMMESHSISEVGVVDRKCWKFCGISVVSFAWGMRRRFKLPGEDGLTVDRMLENIARHCSAFIVFCTILALRSDSFLVDEVSFR
jgi:hypothetical protein